MVTLQDVLQPIQQNILPMMAKVGYMDDYQKNMTDDMRNLDQRSMAESRRWSAFTDSPSQQSQYVETAGQQAGRLFSNFSSFLNRKQREISQAMEVESLHYYHVTMILIVCNRHPILILITIPPTDQQQQQWEDKLLQVIRVMMTAQRLLMLVPCFRHPVPW